MKCYKPDYFDHFRCLASACPDTCCQLWDIDIDPDTAEFYRTLSGPLGEKVRSSIEQGEDGPVIALQDRKCPLCREDGLCQLQAELGPSALSKVCQEFPRLRHDYGSFLELGLELSCPEAARIILTEPYTITCAEIPGGEEPGYDLELMEILLRSRGEFLDFLSSTSMTLPQILSVMLLYGCSVQTEIDGGDLAVLSPAEDLQEALQYAVQPDFKGLIQIFQDLEILTPQWKSLLDIATRDTFWQPCHKAFVRYLAERYWLQAVSDYDLAGRIKFMIACTILLKSLPGDSIWNAHLFSKEVENDWENVDSILDSCYSSPALTDRNLLSLLLT